MQHVATIYAFLGKNNRFTAVADIKVTGQRHVTLDHKTLAAARQSAKMMAWERFEGCTYAPMRKRGEYHANVWI